MATENGAANNGKLEPNGAHVAYGNHEKVVDLEIVYLASDTLDDDEGNENPVESLTEDMIPHTESPAEQKATCVEAQAIFEQSEQNPPPKEQAKIMKLKTIERIV